MTNQFTRICPDMDRRNAGIVAMFDDRVAPAQIAKKFRLSRQHCYTILRANGRSPGMNREDRAPYDIDNPAKLRAVFRNDNQNFLKALFAMHARRGTMPPHFTPTDFYKKLSEYQITIPHDLQGIAL